MKKILIPLVGTVGVGVILVSGMNSFPQTSNPFSHRPANRLPTSTSQAKQQQQTLGLVAIHYQLFHLDQLASNQIAIWIENEQGRYVTTLRASSFTAEGGYKMRPQALPEWRRVSAWSHASAQDIRRVSWPEQSAGMHTAYWDCTDSNSKAVAPGTYVYKIEGNIYWQNRVVFSGTINLGTTGNSTAANAQFFPSDAAKNGELLTAVTATFLPKEQLADVQQEKPASTHGS
ncbi:MAG: DUF2271 domain-containing protein [Sporolactobacillus sp.]